MEPVCHFMYMKLSILLKVLLQKPGWFYFMSRQAGSHECVLYISFSRMDGTSCDNPCHARFMCLILVAV